MISHIYKTIWVWKIYFRLTVGRKIILRILFNQKTKRDKNNKYIHINLPYVANLSFFLHVLSKLSGLTLLLFVFVYYVISVISQRIKLRTLSK